MIAGKPKTKKSDTITKREPKPEQPQYVAYFRPGGGTGKMEAYPHLRANSPEEAEAKFKEWATGYGRLEYWITTEHIHGYTKD